MPLNFLAWAELLNFKIDELVSDTLIDELVSLDAFLQERPSYGDISFTESIIDFSKICINSKMRGA